MAKKGKPKQKSKNKPKVKETTVATIPSPEGSVHFNEFLINCKQPKLLVIPKPKPKPTKNTGKNKGKKNKKPNKSKKSSKKSNKNKAKLAKKKVVVQPDVIPPTVTEPPLFPLIKALLLPTEDGSDLAENALYSDFVVGKNESPVPYCIKAPADELNVLEKRANDTVDEINKVQENIKDLKKIPKPSKPETAELEKQQLLLIKLLNDFENNLEKIRTVLNSELAKNAVVDYHDDEEWVDVQDEQEILTDEKPHVKCQFFTEDEIDAVEAEEEFGDQNAVTKWYEETDLAYLLSPNSSFHKKVSASEDFLHVIDELQDNGSNKQDDVKRNELFKRLKQKFSILLPPPKLKVTKEHLVWMDKKLHKEHASMLKATDELKLFQCWRHLEMKHYIIQALTISLKDAVKSSSPIYYANNDMKAQFVSDQSELVRALDDFKRKAKYIFERAGLTDYWQVHPESIRLGVKPYFEVTIKPGKTDIDDVVQLDEQKLTFIERNMFITKSKSDCKGITKKNSKDSEIEVKVHDLS